jgi:hypothetical protein
VFQAGSSKESALHQNKIKDYNINIPMNEIADPVIEIFY